jgi:hypothetical protein
VWKKSTTKYEARNNGKLEAATEEMSAKHGVLCTEAEKAVKLGRKLRLPLTAAYSKMD